MKSSLWSMSICQPHTRRNRHRQFRLVLVMAIQCNHTLDHTWEHRHILIRQLASCICDSHLHTFRKQHVRPHRSHSSSRIQSYKGRKRMPLPLNVYWPGTLHKLYHVFQLAWLVQIHRPCIFLHLCRLCRVLGKVLERML